MGVGGGFLTFPMFVYGLGVSTFTTVGTDILQIIFTTAYSSIFQYAIYGFVFYTVAVGMLLGSLVGVQIGALVTTRVTGSQIRAFFALTILAGFVNRLCALPKKLDDLGYVSLPSTASDVIETVGTVVFFLIVGVFAVWILVVFARGVAGDRAAAIAAGTHRRLAAPRRFALGLGLLAAFAVLLAFMLAPLSDGKSLLVVADGLFNARAKSSVNSFDKAESQAAKWVGTSVDLGVSPDEVADAEQVLRVLAGHAEGTQAPDGRVRVTGDLGTLAEAAIADAAVLYRNETEGFAADHSGVSAAQAAYSWWLVFDGLSRRYVQEDQAGKAAFTRLVSTKVLEPSFNFRGIAVQSSGESALKLAGLLAFYLAYTMLFGLAIMYIFEGLGICASPDCRKVER